MTTRSSSEQRRREEAPDREQREDERPEADAERDLGVVDVGGAGCELLRAFGREQSEREEARACSERLPADQHFAGHGELAREQ